MFFLVTGFLITAQQLPAQAGELGFKTSAGISEMYAGPVFTHKKSRFYGPSANFGIYYHLHTNKKSLFGLDVMVMQLNARQSGTASGYMYVYNSTRTALIWTDYRLFYLTKYQLTYLCLPIYYGLMLRRLTLYAGVQVGFSLRTYFENYNLRYYPSLNQNESIDQRATFHGPFNSFRQNYGLRGELEYRLNDRLAISGAYYSGVNQLVLQDLFTRYNGWRSWKLQQIALGVRYRLYKTHVRMMLKGNQARSAK